MKLKRALRFFTMILCVCATVLAAPFTHADDAERRSGESAFVYHAEGRDFTITHSGRRTVFSADSVSGEGISLPRSALINTALDTAVELQLIPSGIVLRMEDNTALVYYGTGNGGTNGSFADIQLLYGRIRVVSGGKPDRGNDLLAAINSIVVRNGDFAVQITEGDIGLDFIFDTGAGTPLLSIHAFTGTAEASSLRQPEASRRSITAGAGEYLLLQTLESHTFMERGPLARNIVDYWASRSFAGTPPIAMPAPAFSAELDAGELPLPLVSR